MEPRHRLPHRRLLALLWSAFRPQLSGVLLAAVTSAVAAMLEVVAIGVLALLAKLVADERSEYRGTLGLSQEPLSIELTELLLIGVTAVLSRFLVQVLANWQKAKVMVDYQAAQRNRLFALFGSAPWETSSKTEAGELQTLLTINVDRSSQLLINLGQIVSALGSSLVLVGSAIALSPSFALWLVVLAVLLFLLLRPVSAFARRISRLSAALNLEYAQRVTQAVTTAREIHVFGVAPAVRGEVEQIVAESRGQLLRTQVAEGMVFVLYQSFVLILAFGVMAWIVLQGGLALEVLGALVVLALRLASYTQNIQGQYHALVQRSPFLEQLERAESLHSAPAIRGQRVFGHVETLSFSNVDFAYGTRRALSNVSLEIRAGEMIGIVGPSGAGKSTFINLLLGLHPPAAGQVRVNDVDMQDLVEQDWRDKVAFVPQEPRLIVGSVSDNIRFYRNGIDDAAVHRAAERAAIHQVVAALPNGYETKLGPKHADLSVGQKQRICIARALVRDPELLVLDEPTSALDGASERAIQRTLNSLRGQITLVIVAHRLTTIERCDRIVVLEEGHVVAVGSPAELAATEGYYRRMLVARASASELGDSAHDSVTRQCS